jgi:hypothetical protein
MIRTRSTRKSQPWPLVDKVIAWAALIVITWSVVFGAAILFGGLPIAVLFLAGVVWVVCSAVRSK